jgi:hypothetical protein
MSGWAAAPVRRFPGGAKELLMENRFEVAVGAGTMRAASSPALCFPHRWTPEGVTVKADFTGGHLLHLAAAGCVLKEAFSSCLCLAGLQYVDGLRELAGAPGTAAQLTENPPRLELGIRALAGSAEPGMGAVGFFLGFRLVLAPVRDLRVAASLVALIGEGDQAGRLCQASFRVSV